MIWLILFVIATFVAAGWAFAAGYRGAGGTVRYEYRCGSCGTEVSTTDRLDGKCGDCWGRDFEAVLERLERGD